MIIAAFYVTLLLTVFGRLETAPSHATASRILTSIVRKPGLPDVLLPTMCPSACSQLFHADDATLNDSISDRCSCVCPRVAPVYLNTAGYCIERLDECRYNLVFNSSVESERLIPVVSLPAKNGVVLPKVPILWNDAGITVTALNTVDCAVSAVFLDNVEHRWRAAPRSTLFDISAAHGRPAVMFHGSDHDVAMLTGAVVQLKLSCTGFAADDHCISFRVAGVSGANPYLLPSSNSHVELIFIIVLLFLLALSIGGSLVLWQMCWRIKKRKLISNIQMQFLLHLQQQQEVQKVAEAQAASNDLGPCEFKTLMERIPKRRLYFSAVPRISSNCTSSVSKDSDCSSCEQHFHRNRWYFKCAMCPEREYLDKEMMENPPPMAEQFLTDLRRVIDIARERIRMRRFVPMLITIPEDIEEGRNTMTLEDKTENIASSIHQESPKSDKSVDSGRESRSDSDDSSRDDEEEEKSKHWPEVHCQSEPINSVRNIVNGFEPQSAVQSPTHSRQSSRVLSKTGPNPTRPPVSKIPTLLGRSSPRPLKKSLTLMDGPPLPKMPPPVNPTECRTRRRHAIFPSDPMRNKSLPRRTRNTPRPLEDTTVSS